APSPPAHQGCRTDANRRIMELVNITRRLARIDPTLTSGSEANTAKQEFLHASDPADATSLPRANIVGEIRHISGSRVEPVLSQSARWSFSTSAVRRLRGIHVLESGAHPTASFQIAIRLTAVLS